MKTAGILMKEKVNIARFANIVVFGTCDVRPEVIMKARKGVSLIEKLVTEMFAQDMLPHGLDFTELSELIGIDAQEARKIIRQVLKLGLESYDGTYGRPVLITPERAVYLTAALTIQECGRKSNDIVEYVVRYHISDVLDINAIETKYDMACFVFLIDYFEHCMNIQKISYTRFLNDNNKVKVSCKRIRTFIERQYWYGDPESSVAKNFSRPDPSVPEVLEKVLELLEKIRFLENEIHEEWELNQAFDSIH